MRSPTLILALAIACTRPAIVHVAPVPPPAALVDAAAPFGLTALGDGWTWTKIDPHETRFDWSGRPASGTREVLVSFWLPALGPQETKFLPGLVQSAAANLTDDNQPCEPFDQPSDIVRVLNADRIITVCFAPSRNYGNGFKTGVLHGIVRHGALTIVAVFSADRSGLVPTADAIGLRLDDGLREPPRERLLRRAVGPHG